MWHERPRPDAQGRFGTKRDSQECYELQERPLNVLRRVQIPAYSFSAFARQDKNIIRLPNMPLSTTHTTRKTLPFTCEIQILLKILPPLSSKKICNPPPKGLQLNFCFFSFSQDHLEGFWFFNTYMNTQMLILSIKVFLTQLLTCQDFSWTVHSPFATHIQTHRWTDLRSGDSTYSWLKGLGGDDKNMLGLQKQATWKGTSVIRKGTNLRRKLLSICIKTARGRKETVAVPMVTWLSVPRGPIT